MPNPARPRFAMILPLVPTSAAWPATRPATAAAPTLRAPAAKLLKNAWFIVAPRISVPATKATPAAMASEEAASLAAWNRSPARAVRSMAASLPGALEVVEHQLGSGPGQLAGHPPIG